MLIFGKATGDWEEKAAYAEDKADNEFVALRQVRCEGIEDVRTAMAAIAAFAVGSKCKKFIYHATLNLNPSERLTEAQWMKALDTLEKRLGLTGHYHIAFEHIKHDRQHYHVYWSRLPPHGGAAVTMSNDYYIHQNTAKELEQEFALKLAPRPNNKKPSRTKQAINKRNSEVRLHPDIVTKDATRIFGDSKTTSTFIANLAAAGYTLTRGKNGSYVLVDRQGGYHGLLRRIEGAKIADLRAKFPGLDTMILPSLKAVLKQRHAVSGKSFRKASRGLASIRPQKARGAKATQRTGQQSGSTSVLNFMRRPSLMALIATTRMQQTRNGRKGASNPTKRWQRKPRKTNADLQRLKAERAINKNAKDIDRHDRPTSSGDVPREWAGLLGDAGAPQPKRRKKSGGEGKTEGSGGGLSSLLSIFKTTSHSHVTREPRSSDRNTNNLAGPNRRRRKMWVPVDRRLQSKKDNSSPPPAPQL